MLQNLAEIIPVQLMLAASSVQGFEQSSGDITVKSVHLPEILRQSIIIVVSSQLHIELTDKLPYRCVHVLPYPLLGFRSLDF